ncbi:phage tail sheath subtilisin-like domain-containing protein [Neptunomonas antarctica]|uniref:Mu-like prophage tail sheath protein gpL n=1 Tax=Neptunomonas antarctica TaxID=619304 RepID=A0A1N7MP07_9GAMM|nr:phage tail sheath subtilisin-like domain-containing protein [Neptunomonas antarctica]SIS87873.1 Mu-like prophage tail sheath protein gpL [Neptunomonas antarctica]
MAISFDSIPASLRTPGAYIEFNNELAGAAGIMHKIVAVGQRLPTGTQVEGEPVRVTDPSQAVSLFGRGSMLALMIAAALGANANTELWAIALDDDAAGQAATTTIEVWAPPTAAGTLMLYIGGSRVKVGIASGDDAAAVATSINAAINADLDLPLTATVSTDTVTLTARHKGDVFNALDIRTNYYAEVMPAGLALTIGTMAGGTSNPDLGPAIDALGDEWFNWIINPYTDTSNLVALETELGDRWGPMRQIGCRAFSAFSGTHAVTGTFGSGRNNEHITCLGTGASPTPTYSAAAINCAVAALSLSIDPARPLQTLTLPGMLAPARHEIWTRQERNLLLYDGISTYTVDRDGTCRLERQITMYQTNSASLADASYLDICTPETLERIRFEQRLLQSQKYPRYKLADDGTAFGVGQAVITPKIWRGELLALYRVLEQRGWVEDYTNYDRLLIVERDSDDRNRLNWRDTPNLVNQARVFAGKQQFIV